MATGQGSYTISRETDLPFDEAVEKAEQMAREA